jgi:hypothetical protein
MGITFYSFHELVNSQSGCYFNHCICTSHTKLKRGTMCDKMMLTLSVLTVIWMIVLFPSSPMYRLFQSKENSCSAIRLKSSAQSAHTKRRFSLSHKGMIYADGKIMTI